jgi:NOL1/NOP2/fmu family ribosome biogenesis protein
MALFVVLIVGVVVAQTWVDWRDAHKQGLIPEWAKGAAAASVVAVSLALATSYASAWIEGTVHFASDAGARFLWPEIAFLLATMGLGIAAVRNKRFRWVFVAAGILVGALWVGVTLL